MADYYWIGATGLWTTATNWSPNGTPGAGDRIFGDGRATGNLTGNPATSVQLALIRWYDNCAFSFGTPAAPIACCADNVEVGVESPDGSTASMGEFHISTGTNIGSLFFVGKSKTQGTSGQEPVTIKTGTPASGTHALNVSGGIVGVATGAAGDVATIPVINVTGGRVNVGIGATWTTLTVSATGAAHTYSGSAGSLILYGGFARTEGTALIATITGYAGQAELNHRVAAGVEVTNWNLRGTAFDVSADGSDFDVANTSLRKGSVKSASPTQVDYGTVTIDMDVNTELSVSAA